MSRIRRKCIILGLCGLFYVILFMVLPAKAYKVMLGRRPLGMVASQEALEKRAAEYVNGAAETWGWGEGGALKDEFSFESVYVNHNMISSANEIMEMAKPYLTVWRNAAVICADGQRVAAAKTKEEALHALDTILMPLSRAGYEAGFAESVTINEEAVPAESIKEGDELVNALLVSGGAQIYIAQAGDTAQSVAESEGLTKTQLYNLNPDLNVREVSEGMAVRIGEPADKLHISYNIMASRLISLDPYMEIQMDFSRYETQSHVIQEGIPGKAVAEMLVTVVDGVEVEAKILSESVLQDSVAGLISKGTRPVGVADENPWSEQALESWMYSHDAGSVWESEARRVQAALTTRIGTSWLLWPVAGGGRVSSNYGIREGRLHRGVDIASDLGTPVYAAHSGVVTFSGERGTYGRLVIIDHGFGITTRYAHLDTLLVTTAKEVLRGDPIGLVGSTGRSTGAHLHFEVREDEVASDPMYVLGPPPVE